MPEGEIPQEGGGDKPASITPVVPKDPPAKATDEKPKVEAKPEPKDAPKPVRLGEDDELPENENLFELSKQALNKRLARHTNKELRERFGTDDPDKITADLAELKTLREEKESSRRAALSEQEKLKEDAARERRRADDLEARLRETADAHTFAEYDQTADSVLREHFDPEAMDLAIVKLKKHVLSLDEDELKNPKKVFGEWAKDYAKKNPKFAKTVETAPEPRKIPLGNGADIRAKKDPATADDAPSKKSPKPGLTNSMTKAEYADHKRRLGLG